MKKRRFKLKCIYVVIIISFSISKYINRSTDLCALLIGITKKIYWYIEELKRVKKIALSI